MSFQPLIFHVCSFIYGSVLNCLHDRLVVDEFGAMSFMQQISVRRLWLGNIKPGTEKQDIWMWFERKGFKPSAVVICPRRGTEWCGFVGFDVYSTLVRAFSECNKKPAPWVVDGKYVKIRPATELPRNELPPPPPPPFTEADAFRERVEADAFRDHLEAYCAYFCLCVNGIATGTQK